MRAERTKETVSLEDARMLMIQARNLLRVFAPVVQAALDNLPEEAFPYLGQGDLAADVKYELSKVDRWAIRHDVANRALFSLTDGTRDAVPILKLNDHAKAYRLVRDLQHLMQEGS